MTYAGWAGSRAGTGPAAGPAVGAESAWSPAYRQGTGVCGSRLRTAGVVRSRRGRESSSM